MFEMTPLLAYETGVHLGDGNLTSKEEWNLFRVTYAGNCLVDSKYFEYILPGIIRAVYGKEPRIYYPKGENTIIVVLNSKEVIRFKMKELGLPSGNKLQLKEFPRVLVQKYPADLLRGLADTDFCVYLNKDEPRIEGSFCSPHFASEISRILVGLGIKHQVRALKSHSKYDEFRVTICGKKQLDLWMQKVGFYNPKHLDKIARFCSHCNERSELQSKKKVNHIFRHLISGILIFFSSLRRG